MILSAFSVLPTESGSFFILLFDNFRFKLYNKDKVALQMDEKERLNLIFS